MIRERLARLRVKLDRCDPDVLGSWPCIQDCVVDAAVAFGAEAFDIRIWTNLRSGGVHCVARIGRSSIRIATRPREHSALAWLSTPWTTGGVNALRELCRGLGPRRIEVKSLGQDVEATAWTVMSP